MAMFTAYFDASGHPNDPKGGTMFVSGFVASATGWLKFEREWLALLDEYGIANPFHMTEFIACSGQFATWKGNESRQSEFYGRALKAIQRRTNKAFSQGIILNDFRRLVDSYEIPEAYASASVLSAPIAYCGVGVLVQLARWAARAKQRGLQGPVEVVFDRGDKHRGLLAAAVRELFNIELAFKDKSEAVPIQAADILAWEHARMCGAVMDKDVKKLRMSSWPDVQRLFPGSDEWAYLNAKKLAALFDADGLRQK